MTDDVLNLPIDMIRGTTYRYVMQVGGDARAYRAITAVEATAPCRLTVPGHTVPDGWPVSISNVAGMIQLNRGDPNRPVPEDFYTATVVDGDTIELNEVNAAGFSTYASGGVLMYFEPRSDIASGVIEFFAADDAVPAMSLALDVDAAAGSVSIVVSATNNGTLVDVGARRHETKLTLTNGDIQMIACGTVTSSECGPVATAASGAAASSACGC